ncbi:hypothetical protein ACFQ00_19170 [Sphingosinicella xenopeptidilytica]|uniref:Uncharacterized protein n=1 Tax=Sphingosinicella xenopeptidilytica TaxID=364098 RepID=A0ABW3C9Z1_SPHXN
MAFSAFGSRPRNLEKSAFFKWFGMTPAGDSLWRPKGEAFRDQVVLAAETDADGRLSVLTLSLARAMLDEPRQAMFGRDIVKSFLEGIAGRDRHIRQLAAEIFNRAPPVPVLRGQAPQGVPQTPSAGFLTVMGELQAWSAELSRVRIGMTNDGGRLVVRAERKPLRGFLARLFG